MAMEEQTDVLQFIEVLNTEPHGSVIAFHLLQSLKLKLVPADAVINLVKDAVDEWLLLTGPQAEWREVGDVAVQCVRHVAGSLRGFPTVTSEASGAESQPRVISSDTLEATHFVCSDFGCVSTFHIDFSKILSNLTSMHESCSPAEFSTEISMLLAETQRRTAAGENLVFAGASLGAPSGVLWSTPEVIHALDQSGTPIANMLRNRLGLVETSWEQGRGLFQYSIDTKHLGSGYRATPIEGGNPRFRLEPRLPKAFAPLGATVDLDLLERSVLSAGGGDDDGVGECVSIPFQPDAALWRDLIRDLRFAGALSHAEDLPQSQDEDFRDRVLGERSADEVGAVLKLLFGPPLSREGSAGFEEALDRLFTPEPAAPIPAL